MLKHIILITFLILACFSLRAKGKVQLSCEITSYKKIYYSNSEQGHLYPVIKNSNCPFQIKQFFRNFILGFKGKIHESYFNSIISEEFASYKIRLSPRSIQIVSLAKLFKKRFKLKQNYEMKEITILNSHKMFLLNEEENIYFKCDNCKTVGNKIIKAVITTKANGEKVEWVNTTLKVRTKVLVSLKGINFNERQLYKSDFKLDYIYTVRPEQYFSSIATVTFFKLNKSVPTGTAIKSSDLVPRFLVKYGNPVSIQLENSKIKLTGKAIPTRSGRFNEIIRLKTIPKNKIITGKVVDFNKVIIEL